MRLPYVPNPPPTKTPEEREILDRVLARRGPQGMLAIDRTFFHAPLIADGFNAFAGAIRLKNSLPADCREVAFCRVAALMKCWFEWDIHAPIAKEAGVSEEGLEAVKGTKTNEEGLDERQRAVLKYADAMTLGNRVPDEVFGKVRSYFNDKEMVELTASIAGFNSVARFVTALDVGERN